MLIHSSLIVLKCDFKGERNLLHLVVQMMAVDELNGADRGA